MSPILALDPGTIHSGWVLYDGDQVVDSGVAANATVLTWLCGGGTMRWPHPTFQADTVLAIEMVASYGMPVGKEVFETVWWIGRFTQAWHSPEKVRRVYRKEVCLHLCGSARAKDPNVRQALIDLFPPTGGGKVPQIGIKAQPGPLFGVSTHAWPALGVAVTVRAQMQGAIA